MRVAATAVAIGTSLLVLAQGCSKGEKSSSGEASGSAAAPAAASPGALGTATISGEVKFVGKAPANPAIDMNEEPKCKAAYTTTPHQHIVVVNPNGTLANVLVYVKSGVPEGATYPTPTMPVTLDQDGCMYHPRVFGIMVNQTLAIKNSDGILHNIKALAKKNRPFNISQPVEMTTDRSFSVSEVMLPFECNVHSWMHAYSAVLPYPFYSATGADGSYTIANLPAGTYTIEAWHEKYGAKTETVTVQDGETKSVAFSFAAK